MRSQTHVTVTKGGQRLTVIRDVTLGASIVARMIQIYASSVQEIKFSISVTYALRIGMNRLHVILNALTAPISQQNQLMASLRHANATKHGPVETALHHVIQIASHADGIFLISAYHVLGTS